MNRMFVSDFFHSSKFWCHYKQGCTNGWRTFQPQTFQPHASIPDLSTLDFSTLNFQNLDFSTPDFSTINSSSHGSKIHGWKFWGWKGRGWDVLQPSQKLLFLHLILNQNLLSYFVIQSLFFQLNDRFKEAALSEQVGQEKSLS